MQAKKREGTFLGRAHELTSLRLNLKQQSNLQLNLKLTESDLAIESTAEPEAEAGFVEAAGGGRPLCPQRVETGMVLAASKVVGNLACPPRGWKLG